MAELTEKRVCKNCLEEKPLTEYYKCSKTAWRRKCKTCTNKRMTKWRREHNDLNTKYCTNWREKNTERYREYINTYRREHYDPEKNHTAYMKYYWGKDVVLSK
jgi:hypothetical protein